MLNMITESAVEEAALNWLAELNYTLFNGPTVTPSELLAERDSYDGVKGLRVTVY